MARHIEDRRVWGYPARCLGGQEGKIGGEEEDQTPGISGDQEGKLGLEGHQDLVSASSLGLFGVHRLERLGDAS